MSNQRRGKWERKYRRLQRAVEALYSAAMWMPDRYVENEMEMWTRLRDAAGIDVGTKTALVMPGERQPKPNEEYED